MMGMGFGENLMFDLFPIIFITIFGIVIGTFVVTAVRGAFRGIRTMSPLN